MERRCSMVTEDQTPEVEDEQGLVCFLGRTAEMCMFHFQWPTNEACSQPIKKTDENPSFLIPSVMGAEESHSTRATGRVGDWASGGGSS